jgi:hypothetical protein
MTDAPQRSPRTLARTARAASRRASFARRLKAAGIGPAEVPTDIDAFRRALARQIYMFVNAWHGCREPMCRRHRGCMAPDDVCANVACLPAVTDEQWQKVQAEVRQALAAAIDGEGDTE